MKRIVSAAAVGTIAVALAVAAPAQAAGGADLAVISARTGGVTGDPQGGRFEPDQRG